MEARETSRKKVKASLSPDLRDWLDGIHREFHAEEFLQTDPLGLAHRYSNPLDRELVAFIAALFAYGNVRAMQKAINSVLEPWGRSPSQTLRKASPDEITQKTRNLYYRFYTQKEIHFLFSQLQKLLQNGERLEESWSSLYGGNTFEWIQRIRHTFLGQASSPSRGLKFMFSDPIQGCGKRWHMLLRWMIRKDSIDLGLWTTIKPSDLYIPLDTHVYSICRQLGLAKQKSPTQKSVIELTEIFRKWDPADPIKYDFALCRLGVLKIKDQKLSSLITSSA